MIRYAMVAGLLAVALTSAPALAVSKKDKEATCKFGADSQNLQGQHRIKFMKDCMANRDDPRGPGGGAPPKN